MKLNVKIVRCSSGVYRAWCPALPGCIVTAMSEKGARQRIEEAVGGYLAKLEVNLPEKLGILAHIE